MSRKTIFIIITVVVLLHIGAFWYFGRMKALPDARYIPPANFGFREEVWEDPKTGEKTTFREIRVSTKIADEKTIEKYRKQIAQRQAEIAAKEAAATADEGAKVAATAATVRRPDGFPAALAPAAAAEETGAPKVETEGDAKAADASAAAAASTPATESNAAESAAATQ